MRKRTTQGLAGAVCLLLAQAALIQAQPPPPPVGVRVVAPEAQTPPLVQPSSAPAPVVAKLPTIVLKGRVIAKDRAPAILVDVDGRLQFLTKGTVLTAPGNLTLRVTEMSASEVKILVSPRNETIVLR